MNENITIKKKHLDAHLEVQMGVIVPSTSFVDVEISDADFDARVEKVRRYMASFGGYTSVSAIGGYLSKAKGLVTERSLIVWAYADKRSYQRKKGALLRKVKAWGKDWKQESMGLILEDDMFLVKPAGVKK